MIKKIINVLLKILGIKKENDINEILIQQPNEEENPTYKYIKKNIMTNYEFTFYNKIKELEKNYMIVPQINLATIIKKEGKFKYQNELYRNIDFAIFSKDYKKLLLLIEINDGTHNTRERRERDLKVKKLCNDIEVEIINFYTNYPNEKEYILNRIKKYIEKEETSK